MAQVPTFEDNRILAKFLGDFSKTAEARFRQSARAANLELTGELISSIRAGTVERGRGYIQGSVLISELLSIKDMKTIRRMTVRARRSECIAVSDHKTFKTRDYIAKRRRTWFLY